MKVLNNVSETVDKLKNIESKMLKADVLCIDKKRILKEAVLKTIKDGISSDFEVYTLWRNSQVEEIALKDINKSYMAEIKIHNTELEKELIQRMTDILDGEVWLSMRIDVVYDDKYNYVATQLSIDITHGKVQIDGVIGKNLILNIMHTIENGNCIDYLEEFIDKIKQIDFDRADSRVSYIGKGELHISTLFGQVPRR